MRRKLIFAALLLVALVLLGLAGAWVFRKDFARSAIDQALQDAGILSASYDLTDVGFSQAHLTNLVLGDAGEVRIAALTASYDFFDALNGKLSELRLESPQIKLDLTGNGPPLGSLQGLLAGEGGAGLPAPLYLQQAEIAVTTLWGDYQVKLDGELTSDQEAMVGKFILQASGPLGAVAGTLDLLQDGAGLSGGAVVESGSLDLPGGRISGLLGELAFDFRGPPVLKGELTLSGIDTPDQLFKTADLLFVWEGNDLVLEGLLRDDKGLLSAKVDSTATDMLSAPQLKSKVVLDVKAGAALWALLDLPVPSSGAVSLIYEGEGKLAPLSDYDAAAGGLLSWLAAGDSKGRLGFAFKALTYDKILGPIDGGLLMDLVLSRGLIAAGLPQDARITIAALDPAWLTQELELPDDTATALATGVTLDLPAEAVADPRFYLQPSGDGHLLDLAGTLRVQATSGAGLASAGVVTLELNQALEIVSMALQGLVLQAQELPVDGTLIGSLRASAELTGDATSLTGTGEITLNIARTEIGRFPVEDVQIHEMLQLDYRTGGLTATFTEPSPLIVTHVLNGERAFFDAPAQLQVDSGVIEATWAPLRITHDTILTLGEQTVILSGGDKPQTAKGNFGRVRLAGEVDENFVYQGTAGLAGAELSLPYAGGIRMKGVTLAWVFPADANAEAPGEITIEDLQVTTAIGRFKGLSLTAQILDTPGLTTLTGSGRGPNGNGKLALRLVNDPLADKGNLQVVWGPVTFKPDGLQPGALLPDLADYSQVQGKATATLNLSWNSDGLRSDAFVELKDLAFVSPSATISGLNTQVVLTSLDPPATPPNQRLTIASLDPGLPMQNLDLLFQIKAGKQPGIILEQGAFDLASGSFRLEESFYDFKKDNLSSTLEVDDLDLALLSRDLEVEDFAMEGRMSGTLPFELEAGEVFTIKKGRLTNTTPGVIRYGKPGGYLDRAGGDENLGLAFQALENFQYQTLDMTINKASDGATGLKVLLEGNNPEVLDGYPFKININLNTNLSNVLEALRLGYKLNPDLFNGGWDFN